MQTLVVSESYQNYQNGAVNNQLTDVAGGIVCRSVEVVQGHSIYSYTFLCTL